MAFAAHDSTKGHQCSVVLGPTHDVAAGGS
jgi:hypothetical protein